MTWVMSWKRPVLAHLRFGTALLAGLETQPRAAVLIPGLLAAREALVRGAELLEERIADKARARVLRDSARLALLAQVSETASAATIADRLGGDTKSVLFSPKGVNRLGSLRGQRLARGAGDLLARLAAADTQGMEALRERCEPDLRASHERFVAALAAWDAAALAARTAQQKVQLLRQAFVEAVVVVQAGLNMLFPRQRALIESMWPPRPKRRRARKVEAEVETEVDEEALDEEEEVEDEDVGDEDAVA